MDDERRQELHDFFKSESRDKEADVLFIGDDHIALLEQSSYFREHLAPLHCLVFGILGDRIAQVRERVVDNELDGLQPKVIVVSAGTNDTFLSVDETLEQLSDLMKVVREKNPQAKVFLLKLLPSGKMPNTRREWADKVNGLLEEKLRPHSLVIDVDETIIGTNGLIDAHLMFDFVHLTQEGYAKIFEPVLVAVNSVLEP